MRVADDLIDDNVESAVVVVLIDVLLHFLCLELQSILEGEVQFLQV